MTKLTGYIQRRSGSLTPDQQREVLREYGIVCGGDPKHDPIYDTLEDALPSVKKGSQLVVWELGVIGLGNINKVFTELGKLGAEGIYTLKKPHKLWPCHPEADQKHADARLEITKFNSRVRTDSTKVNSGKPLSDAWAEQDEIRSLSENDMHVDDIAAKFKVSRSTIDRILK